VRLNGSGSSPGLARAAWNRIVDFFLSVGARRVPTSAWSPPGSWGSAHQPGRGHRLGTDAPDRPIGGSTGVSPAAFFRHYGRRGVALHPLKGGFTELRQLANGEAAHWEGFRVDLKAAEEGVMGHCLELVWLPFFQLVRDQARDVPDLGRLPLTDEASMAQGSRRTRCCRGFRQQIVNSSLSAGRVRAAPGRSFRLGQGSGEARAKSGPKGC
jgi:hypothetical protein